MNAVGQLRTPAATLSFVRFRGQSRHGFRAAEGPFIAHLGHWSWWNWSVRQLR